MDSGKAQRWIEPDVGCCRRADTLLRVEGAKSECLKVVCGRHGNIGCTAADVFYAMSVMLAFISTHHQ